MNKRLKKKSEKMRRAALHKILDLVLDINGMQKSDKELTGEHPTVFLNFYGHIAKINVNVHNCGWEVMQDADVDLECCLVDNYFYDTPMQMAEKLENHKEELIKSNAI